MSTVYLNTLGSWWATVGAVAVASGDSNGWHTIEIGQRYCSFSSWLRHRWVELDKAWDKEPVSCSLLSKIESHTLAYSIAAKHDSLAHQFGEHLLSNLRRFNGGDKLFAYTESLHPFMLELYAKWVGEEAAFREDVPNPMGRYGQIFLAWSDQAAFATAMHDICVYHCEQTFDVPGYPMFVFPPYNVFPVEIIALHRVRQDLGLETPSPAHPLMESPLARIPDRKRSEEPVELIDCIMEYIRTSHPDAGEPWN